MTQYLSDVPLSSIQNVSISDSGEENEIDIIGKDTNIVTKGSEEAQQVEIEFTLLKQMHPERMDVEEQQEEVKELASNDVSENYFNYSGYEYFLSIGDVSIAEEASMDTIREGTISATALPWPKHYPDGRRGVNKLASGDIYMSMNVDSDIDVVTLFPQGEVNYSLDIESTSNLLFSVLSEVVVSLDAEADIRKEKSVSGELQGGLVFDDVITDLQESSVGFTQFSLSVESSPNTIQNVESNLDYSVDIVGDINVDLNSLFGRRFGRSFGGT